jgi:hypothetical protein
MNLNKSLIGKKIKVFTPKRFYPGSKVMVEDHYIVGKCTFAGINEYLGVKQITVDRTPVFPVREIDVEILK